MAIYLNDKQIFYDLAMLYAREFLRRTENEQFNDIVQTAPMVKGIFDSVYEVLSGSSPEDDAM